MGGPVRVESLSYRAEGVKGAWSRALPVHLDSPQTLVLAFGARRYGPEGPANEPLQAPLRELVAGFPQSAVVGCSTSGEIEGSRVDDGTVSVAVCRFEHSRVVTALTPIAGADDSGAAGARLAAGLPAEGLRAVFVLSDGLGVNGTPLVAALSRGLPAGVRIAGGLAGDGSRFESTWVLAGGTVRPGQVCAVGLYGERLQVGGGHEGGWSDFGPLRRITRSEGNVLFELDGRPALDLYKEYLGRLADGLPGAALLFPLSIRSPRGGTEALVRTILGIDEVRRSMTFAGDVPQGFEARLMRTTGDGLVNSAGLAMAGAVSGFAEPQGEEGEGGEGGAGSHAAVSQSLVVSVSCVGRRLVLGERTEEEVESLMEGAPPGAVHVGFYSYGEIAAGCGGSASQLHNQTMTVTVLREV